MGTITEQEQLVVENTVATNILEVVGQGIDFPLRFTRSRQVGTVATSNAGERIHDSIHLILSTRPGERLFNPEFGSKLPLLVFEPNDIILHRLLRIHTAEALGRWERRIEILEVVIVDRLDNDASKIGIRIEYRIRNSHIRGSYVYPFVREGMPTGRLYAGSETSRSQEAGTLD